MKKTKLTRTLMAACSVVVLSAVMYGCVHDDDDAPAVSMPTPAETALAAAETALTAAEAAVMKAEADAEAAESPEERAAARTALAAARTALAAAVTAAEETVEVADDDDDEVETADEEAAAALAAAQEYRDGDAAAALTAAQGALSWAAGPALAPSDLDTLGTVGPSSDIAIVRTPREVKKSDGTYDASGALKIGMEAVPYAAAGDDTEETTVIKAGGAGKTAELPLRALTLRDRAQVQGVDTDDDPATLNAQSAALHSSIELTYDGLVWKTGGVGHPLRRHEARPRRVVG